MNPTPLPPVDPQADDALDRLLREYFQQQMPRHFPPLPVNETVAASRMQPPSPLSRSRWVMAVCVALVLLAFGWLLRNQTSNLLPVAPSIHLNDNTATGTDPMPPKAPAKLPK
jgi:hypothetical protein